MKTQMIIANRLTDGRVVFLNNRGGWVNEIASGVVFFGERDAAQRLLEAQRGVEQNVIVDPYIIDIQTRNDRRQPVLVRERIRAFGPSVDAGFGGGE